ncbi:MAG: FapA family protein, partial [Spirochaetes bacterium]|nr:FapA family protein [Spirochaetota bacterium]
MEQLREILKKLVESESNVESILVKGQTLETALKKACDQFDAEIKDLDYEIIQYGNKGIMGIGKKEYHVKVYRSHLQNEVLQHVLQGDIEDQLEAFKEEEKIVDKDGEIFVRIVQAGILIKATAPVGNGEKPKERDAIDLLQNRGATDYDSAKMKKIIKETKGEYVQIGEMPINVVNDSSATVNISSDKMKAYLTIIPPKPGGFDLEIEEIRNILKNNTVLVGIKDETLAQLEDYSVYNEPVLVAEGIKVKNGKDAVINYKFNTEKKIEL